MTIRNLLLGVIGFAATALPTAALADNWSAIASTCEPDTAWSDALVKSGTSIKFAAGKTGWARARCNVTGPTSMWNTMSVTFKDQDGLATNGFVTAVLHGVTINNTGGTTGVDSTMTTFSSAYTSVAQTAYQTKFVNFGQSGVYNIDFGIGAYYVEMLLYRSNTSIDPEIQSVQLWKR